MMKRILVVLVLVLVLVSISGFAQTGSTADEKYPMPTVSNPLIRFVVPTTQTLTCGDTATACPTLPAGTKRVIFTSSVGATNFGSASVSTGLTYPSIASGAYKEFDLSPLYPTPVIYFCNTTAGASTTIRITTYK